MALVSGTHSIDITPGIMHRLTIHCSQGDVGREININLKNNWTTYIVPNGANVVVHGVRSDGGSIGPHECEFSGNVITFLLTEDMTAVSGPAILELSIAKDNEILGTSNFALLVEESAFPVGVTYDNDASVFEKILFYVQNTVIPTEAISIDQSLTISGAAADAKAVGDALRTKKLTIDSNGIIRLG